MIKKFIAVLLTLTSLSAQTTAPAVPQITPNLTNLPTDPTILSLNAQWKFLHIPAEQKAPENSLTKNFDSTAWTDTSIPHCWNLHSSLPSGYAIYRRTFSFTPPANTQTHIVLGAPHGDCTIHINGKELPAIKPSLTKTTLNIQSLLEQGENTIAVLVPAITDGHEPIFNGLTWELTLRALPLHHITFANASFTLTEKKAALEIKTINPPENHTLHCEIINPQGAPAIPPFTLPSSPSIENPTLWNPEQPSIYTVKLTLKDSQQKIIHTLDTKAAAYQISVKDSTLHLNEKPFTLRAITRMPHNPRSGFYQSDAEMKAEILALKRANLNAVDLAGSSQNDAYISLCYENGILPFDSSKEPFKQIKNIRRLAAAEVSSKSPTYADNVIFTHWKDLAWLKSKLSNDKIPQRSFAPLSENMPEGLSLPNGTPNPPLEEVKKSFQQVHTTLTSYAHPTIKLHLCNNNFFATLNHLKASWKLMKDGAPVEQGEFAISENVSINLTQNLSPGAEYFFRVRYDLREATSYHPAGMPVAWDEFLLQAATPSYKAQQSNEKPIVEKNNDNVTIKTAKSEITFSTKSGDITRIISNQHLIWENSSLTPYVRKAGTITRFNQASTFDLTESNNTVIIKVQKTAGPQITYTIHGDASIHISSHYQAENQETYGFTTALNSRLALIKWYGKGPHESPRGREDGAWIAIHDGVLPMFFHRYIRPRFCGIRSHIRWAEISSPTGGTGLKITAANENLLDITSLSCAPEEIANAKLYSDVPNTGAFHLCVETPLTKNEAHYSAWFSFPAHNPVNSPQGVMPRRIPPPAQAPVKPPAK